MLHGSRAAVFWRQIVLTLECVIASILLAAWCTVAAQTVKFQCNYLILNTWFHFCPVSKGRRTYFISCAEVNNWGFLNSSQTTNSSNHRTLSSFNWKLKFWQYMFIRGKGSLYHFSEIKNSQVLLATELLVNSSICMFSCFCRKQHWLCCFLPVFP